MSNANPTSNAISGTVLPVAPALRRLAALAAEAVLSAVMARAVRRAHRELAALDDRTLADIGLDRSAVEALSAISRRTALGQIPWHRLQTSA